MTILKGSEKIVASLNQFGVVRRVSFIFNKTFSSFY